MEFDMKEYSRHYAHDEFINDLLAFKDKLCSYRDNYLSEESGNSPQSILEFANSFKLEDWMVAFPERGESYSTWVDKHLSVGRKIKSVITRHGETLTIGDETNFGVITFFFFKEGLLSAMFDHNSNSDYSYPVASVHLVKRHDSPSNKSTAEPLRLYDVVSIVDKHSWDLTERFVIDNHTNRDHLVKHYVIFSGPHHAESIAAAKQFIEDNKPVYSKKQVSDALIIPAFIEHDLRHYSHLSRFTQMVKEKLFIK